MRKTILFVLLAISNLAAAGCSSENRVSTKLADERYKLVAESLPGLVTGGRVSQIQWADDGSSVEFVRGERRFSVSLPLGEIHELPKVNQANDAGGPGAQRRGRSARSVPPPARGRQRDRAISPDGAWIARCKDWNVVIEAARNEESGNASDDSATTSESQSSELIHVTTDGNRKFRFGTASWVYGEELDQHDAMWWSPDSTKLAFYEFDERDVPDHFIAGDLTKLHTKLLTEGYPKPGEPNPIANLLIYDVNTRKTVRVQPAESADWYTYDVQFTPDKDRSVLLFHRTNRHQNVMQLVAADPSTGLTRIVLTETQETWQDNSPEMRFLEDGHRFIWATEKTGWKQYELRDLDGSLIATLTHGEYPASSIVRVDEKSGYLYYMAFSETTREVGGPLNAQLHRVKLDGTEQVRLTKEPWNHSVTLSPDGNWFITEYQGIGVPPTTALYQARGAGKRIATLAESDLTQFKKLGMTLPELFTFKADDGKTDLYGVLYKPSHFDPHRKYPLVIDVYGGPLSQSVRGRFSPGRPDCEYGVLIAAIDNRGTQNRGKAFESATYLRLGDVDIKDQADAVRYLKQRSYVDPTRIGIMGHSYGGYMSALALLKYPDLFHVACAGGTVTDWRNYDSIYTERFMRTPQENSAGYDAGSCLTYVNNLKGKLMLLHGAVDDNVHTNNAWQLIDALQKAGKPFELMFWPNAGHSLGGGANKVRWDFLRRNLCN